jgi:hypothetical protein
MKQVIPAKISLKLKELYQNVRMVCIIMMQNDANFQNLA